MNAIYFIEIEGIKYYKCDTFWSKSANFCNAKLHDDTRVEDFIRSYNYNFEHTGKKLHDLPNSRNSEDYENFRNQCIKNIGALFGYQTFDDSEKENDYVLKKDAILNEPKYFYRISDIDDMGNVTIEDYRKIERDKKIDKINE